MLPGDARTSTGDEKAAGKKINRPYW